MKLVSVRIRNYKCIDDSGVFSVGDLTCLAGKNESGKTALLQALRRLNPVEKSERNFISLMEYPRRRMQDVDSGDPSLAAVLTTRWQLSDEDLDIVSRVIGPETLKDTLVTIERGYTDESQWSAAVDEKQLIIFLAGQSGKLTEQAKRRVLGCDSLTELHKQLTKETSTTKGEQQLLDYIDKNMPKLDPLAILRSRLPKFLYFPTYGTLPGKVPVEQLSGQIEAEEDLTEGDEYFLALLQLANTDLKQLQEAGQFEQLRATLEAVSNRLSDEIFEYWTQNRSLAVDFSYDEARPQDPPPFNDGHVFHLRVRNQRHRVTVGFDERSAGFVWFFSFLVWFSQTEKSYGDKLIILLDEPGLNLHAKAQGDLLRYTKEKLLPKYQVVYTTHSPFMIDTDNLNSVRTVEDTISGSGNPEGTRVRERIMSSDADTLLPLRAALGYDITQSLFIGEHCLLVEGPSDLLYLRWASRQLVARNRLGLDRRWTVTPVGGIDKVGSFNALFSGNHLDTAVLTDFHKGDKNKVRQLNDSGLLKAGHLFTASQFTGQEEADVEDMLGRELYIQIVAGCFGLVVSNRLPQDAPNGGPSRVLEEVKEHFRTVATDVPEFDHLSPAIHLVEHESGFVTRDGVEFALDRFEELFRQLNKLLPATSAI